MVKKEDNKPIKFVLYKKIDEATGRGEERLSIYVWYEDKEDSDKSRYIEVFEKRAAALSKDNEHDPRMKWQTRERVLAIMCVDARYYAGEKKMDFIVETIPDPHLEQKVVRENIDGKEVELVKRYRIEQVGECTITRFANALETAYNSRDYRAIITVENIRGKDSRLEVELSIPQWNPEQTIVLPMAEIPETISKSMDAGKSYLGMVNIGCEQAKNVYVRNWEGPIPPVSDEEWERMISDGGKKQGSP